MKPLEFKEGEIYRRQEDIHAHFGGIKYSGVSPAPKSRAVFIFTGQEGANYGYSDSWSSDGLTFVYTGHGQRGDMKFEHGNKAIRDHVAAGHALHLFQKVQRKDGLHAYIGEMQCIETVTSRGPDLDGADRLILQFVLVRVRAADATSVDEGASDSRQEAPLVDLRRIAYEAVMASPVPVESASRTLYKRAVSVAKYVLARADGRCEYCEQLAPFLRRNGNPYLETHHIERLSDGGLDSPLHMAALCPGCHRRAHYGQDSATVNNVLRARVKSLEAASPVQRA